MSVCEWPNSAWLNEPSFYLYRQVEKGVQAKETPHFSLM